MNKSSKPRFQKELQHIYDIKKKIRIQKDLEKADELAYKLAEAEGSLVECGCCYSEYVFDKIVACTEGHMFCCTCLNHFAEERVFGEGKSKLNC